MNMQHPFNYTPIKDISQYDMFSQQHTAKEMGGASQFSRRDNQVYLHPINGGQSVQLNRIRKQDLMGFAPAYISDLFQCETSPPATFANPIQLPAFLQNIMNRTRLTTNTLVTAFFYLNRLKQLHPRCKGSQGSGHRLFLAATILAAKYMYDDTFDNTAWATVSSGLFDLDQVNHMERELLGFLDFGLFIQPNEWILFYENLRVAILNQNAKGNYYVQQSTAFPSVKQGWVLNQPVSHYRTTIPLDPNFGVN